MNIALLSRDIEYSFPHRISVTEIREKVLKDIEDEQNRLDKEKKVNLDAKNQTNDNNKNTELNYENYFGIDPNCNLKISINLVFYKKNNIFFTEIFLLYIFFFHKKNFYFYKINSCLF